MLGVANYAQHQLLKADAFYRVMQDSAFRVMDVRSGMEYDAVGHIPGAISVNFFNKKFPDKVLVEFPVTEPVMVYCLSGHRSADAVMLLQKMGYHRIYELKGGFISWMSAGLPVE